MAGLIEDLFGDRMEVTAELEAKMLRQVDKLPDPRQREALLRYYVKGETFRKISLDFPRRDLKGDKGVAATVVRQAMASGIFKLRKALQ